MMTLAIIVALLIVFQNLLFMASVRYPYNSLGLLCGVVAAVQQLATVALCAAAIF